MRVLGLTGSIGMGKSTTAGMFRAHGVPVHDADAAVHALYRGRAVPLVEAAFPGAVIEGVNDRERLAALVLGDEAAMRRLEGIVHPLVREEEARFLEEARAEGHRLAILDVPLLFETGGAARVDGVVVVTARPDIQRARVLARPGMTEERFAALSARQVPDARKRARATYLVDTSDGFEAAEAQVEAILAAEARRGG